MNLVDIAIIAILAIGFAIGCYKGFLVSLLSLVSSIGSWVAAFLGFRPLAALILEKTNFDNTLLYFTAGTEKLSDLSVANTDIFALSQERITEIITKSHLPEPVENMILNNIFGQVFADRGITTMSDYFNQTIINLSLSLISFLIIFLAVRVIFAFIIGLVDYVAQLPVLRQFDKLAGGVSGLLQAAVILVILFAAMPILISVVPAETIDLNKYVEASKLAGFFYNHNWIFNILESVL